MTLPNDDTGHLVDPGSPDDTDEFDRDADREPPALDPLNGEPDAVTTGAPLGPPD
ncbi:hypothetical protein ACQP2P_22630 [Dactylosporangium sp. CA-139114]|uniref:hypothetical protein n=1 Tax=Dactylosporangium sp. CA-139114 TaxID=3239931 RepID=UPI003D998A5E